MRPGIPRRKRKTDKNGGFEGEAMKTLNLIFTDREFEKLRKSKEASSYSGQAWHVFLFREITKKRNGKNE